MNFKNVNWLAIIVTIIACNALGFLWYGSLFQDQWMAANGFAMDGDTMLKNGEAVSASQAPMIVNTIGMIVYALFMHWLLERSNAQSLGGGFKTGLFMGFVLYFGITIGNMFAMNDYEITLIDGSYTLVLWTVIGVIMGAWPKKAKG